MNMRYTYIFAAILAAFAGLATAEIVYAANVTNTYVPLADIGSGSSNLSDLYSSNNLADYINKVFTFAIGLGAMAAVLRLAYAGYLYMGQSDMWSHKGQAKTIIGDVTLGLLLLLSIWIILNQINPDILQLNALKNIQPVEAPTPTPTPSCPMGQTWTGAECVISGPAGTTIPDYSTAPVGNWCYSLTGGGVRCLPSESECNNDYLMPSAGLCCQVTEPGKCIASS